MKFASFILLPLLAFLASCTQTPEPYAVYQSLLISNGRAQILFVGKNWEIKDGVNTGKTKDQYDYHTQEFWSYKVNETLVAFRFVNKSQIGVYVIPLEIFSKEYRLIRPN